MVEAKLVDSSCRALHGHFAELITKQGIQNGCLTGRDIADQGNLDLKRMDDHLQHLLRKGILVTELPIFFIDLIGPTLITEIFRLTKT